MTDAASVVSSQAVIQVKDWRWGRALVCPRCKRMEPPPYNEETVGMTYAVCDPRAGGCGKIYVR